MPGHNGGVYRRIVHVDLDCFYAQVETRDDPRLRGRPVAVGGRPPRGVIATANYEARRFGVHSALATRIALDRCPGLVLIEPRFDHYRAVSEQIREVFHSYTDLVEPLSLDEAYLDVSEPKRGPRSGTIVARLIQRDIWRATGLTCSAGVSFNKFLAKVASGIDKPAGLTVVEPAAAVGFIERLPITEFFGVGPKTAERLRGIGITTGAQLRAADPGRLEQLLGKPGRDLYEIAHCRDDRPVDPHRERKSASSETTFVTDLHGLDELCPHLPGLCADVARRLAKHGLVGSGVVVKVKYADHTLLTRQYQLGFPLRAADEIERVAREILATRVPLDRSVRLLGVGVYDLADARGEGTQPALFPTLPRP